MNKFLFVYGTLKTGHGNNDLLNGSQFIGEAYSKEDSYCMKGYNVPVVSFEPSLKNNINIPLGRVKGEVWEVEKEILEGPIDALEGHPNFYQREEKVFFVPSLQKEIKCWIYLFPIFSRFSFTETDEDGVLTW